MHGENRKHRMVQQITTGMQFCCRSTKLPLQATSHTRKTLDKITLSGCSLRVKYVNQRIEGYRLFGTVIVDRYKKSEVKEIVLALDELCSPKDNYGWASTGIYSFWNYYTKEIYYIGLAVDLTERFKQHNGLVEVAESACKIKQIEDYFSKYEILGYSIFVQSPLSQAITSKNAPDLKINPEKYGFMDFRTDPAREAVKRVEGILIEAYRLANGDFPEWNKVGGATCGQKSAKLGNYEIVKASVLI